MGATTYQDAQYWQYSTIDGYFLQDDPATDPLVFDYTKSFGLLNRTYDTDTNLDPQTQKSQWQHLEHHLARLNDQSGHRTQYKIIFLGRHGEGFHNVAEAFYGTAAWDCYWSHLDGNDTSTWSDAQLTPIGLMDAAIASQTWSTQLQNFSMPFPQSFYSSPLTRCMQTAFHTFSPLNFTPSASGPSITIKELFREGLGVHTCDRRSTRTEIDRFWKDMAKDSELEFVFEAGFEEHDQLWDSEMRETDVGLDRRSRAVLDDLFANDKHTWISISSHSGMIASLLRVLGHRAFSLRTGAVIPVLVRAELVSGQAPPIEGEPFKKEPMCSEPPPPTPLREDI